VPATHEGPGEPAGAADVAHPARVLVVVGAAYGDVSGNLAFAAMKMPSWSLFRGGGEDCPECRQPRCLRDVVTEPIAASA
jgi:hypothetical protein